MSSPFLISLHNVNIRKFHLESSFLNCLKVVKTLMNGWKDTFAVPFSTTCDERRALVQMSTRSNLY